MTYYEIAAQADHQQNKEIKMMSSLSTSTSLTSRMPEVF